MERVVDALLYDWKYLHGFGQSRIETGRTIAMGR